MGIICIYYISLVYICIYNISIVILLLESWAFQFEWNTNGLSIPYVLSIVYKIPIIPAWFLWMKYDRYKPVPWILEEIITRARRFYEWNTIWIDVFYKRMHNTLHISHTHTHQYLLTLVLYIVPVIYVFIKNFLIRTWHVSTMYILTNYHPIAIY